MSTVKTKLVGFRYHGPNDFVLAGVDRPDPAQMQTKIAEMGNQWANQCMNFI